MQAERQRERRLREAGADVVRWSASDVPHAPAAERLAQRIFGAMSVAQANARLTGVVTPTMHPLAAS